MCSQCGEWFNVTGYIFRPNADRRGDRYISERNRIDELYDYSECEWTKLDYTGGNIGQQ